MALSTLILCVEFTWIYKLDDKLLTGISWRRIDYSGVSVENSNEFVVIIMLVIINIRIMKFRLS